MCSTEQVIYITPSKSEHLICSDDSEYAYYIFSFSIFHFFGVLVAVSRLSAVRVVCLFFLCALLSEPDINRSKFESTTEQRSSSSVHFNCKDRQPGRYNSSDVCKKSI